MYLEALALIPAIAVGAAPAPVTEVSIPTPPRAAADLSVLTYNVKGLPWPLASGRAEALRAIGDELARITPVPDAA